MVQPFSRAAFRPSGRVLAPVLQDGVSGVRERLQSVCLSSGTVSKGGEGQSVVPGVEMGPLQHLLLTQPCSPSSQRRDGCRHRVPGPRSSSAGRL